MDEQGTGGPGGSLPPAGWYPDPESPGQRRYWDGAAWTDWTDANYAQRAGEPQGAPPTEDTGGTPAPSTGDPAAGTGATGGGWPEPEATHGAGTTGGGWTSGGDQWATGGQQWDTGGQAWGAGGQTWSQQPQQWGGAPAAKVDPWLWQSIVATLLCCLPLGIVGIVFASRSQSAMARGDVAEARTNADKARTWTLVSAGIGLVGVLIWIVLIFAGIGGAFVDTGF